MTSSSSWRKGFAILTFIIEHMPKLSPPQIEEMNEIIEQIQKALKPKCEIGAQSKSILTSLLAASKVKKKAMFFKCKRELSDEIVNYFVNEKKVTRSRFHTHARDAVYLLF